MARERSSENALQSSSTDEPTPDSGKPLVQDGSKDATIEEKLSKAATQPGNMFFFGPDWIANKFATGNNYVKYSLRAGQGTVILAGGYGLYRLAHPSKDTEDATADNE
jgi:hypothetical protein